jgi:hydroxymethylpyrimidine/phosphomethylpyrimidine kinase
MIARALTIAGSDSSGGAGIQADLKTFTVLRVYGMSAITAVTAQNTRGVGGIHPLPPAFVRQQIEAVVTDIGVDAAKTGMLANRAIVGAVAGAVRDLGIHPLVVDPVMVAESGAPLLEEDALAALRDELLPLAALVTPNAPEAAALLGMPVETLADMHEAARRLLALGVRAALVKGGHLAGAEAIDVLHEGGNVCELRSARIATRHTHGTGCMLAAAIAAGLAERRSLADATGEAKRFVTAAIRAGLGIGKGGGPANPLAWLDEPGPGRFELGRLTR